MPSQKIKVAVLFGGRSPEHDVSIITGLQALKALDSERYDAFPVYIAPSGAWLTGDLLRERSAYIPSAQAVAGLTQVTLDITPRQKPRFVTMPVSRFQKMDIIEFDVALLAFHGLIGEDGGVQGLFETANIPYTGMRQMASAVLMDKAATKRMIANTGVPQLSFVEIKRPAQGLLLTVDELTPLLEEARFPCCIKPAHLGSSIGVARVTNAQEVSDVLVKSIFRFDDTALLEPFVENLVEYNVAVRLHKGRIVTSAIERPKHSSELLDFKAKYMSGGSKKTGGAKTQQSSQGMLSLTRDINPALPPEFEAKIRDYATKVFLCTNGSGAPRLDFLCNGKTGELWFNEANPMPGSYGYFLWEASKENPTLFTELLDGLIDEAFALHERAQIPADPTPEDARLFNRN